MSALESSPVVTIIGSIAAGKTTLATALAEQLRVPAFLEAPQDNPYLERMRFAPATICIWNQAWYLAEALDSFSVAQSNGGVLDHSALEVVAVHSPLFSRYGWLTDSEISILQRLATSTMRLANMEPDLYIYLTADPADLIQRVAARGRIEDAEPSREYLEEVAACREAVISRALAPVIKVNTSVVDIRRSETVDQIASAVRAHLTRRSE